MASTTQPLWRYPNYHLRPPPSTTRTSPYHRRPPRSWAKGCPLQHSTWTEYPPALPWRRPAHILRASRTTLCMTTSHWNSFMAVMTGPVSTGGRLMTDHQAGTTTRDKTRTRWRWTRTPATMDMTTAIYYPTAMRKMLVSAARRLHLATNRARTVTSSPLTTASTKRRAASPKWAAQCSLRSSPGSR